VQSLLFRTAAALKWCSTGHLSNTPAEVTNLSPACLPQFKDLLVFSSSLTFLAGIHCSGDCSCEESWLLSVMASFLHLFHTPDLDLVLLVSQLDVEKHHCFTLMRINAFLSMAG
jgi:hypothetical protein